MILLRISHDDVNGNDIKNVYSDDHEEVYDSKLWENFRKNFKSLIYQWVDDVNDGTDHIVFSREYNLNDSEIHEVGKFMRENGMVYDMTEVVVSRVGNLKLDKNNNHNYRKTLDDIVIPEEYRWII